MQVSRKYLEQHFDLSMYSNEQLAEKFTNAGFEVEHIESYDFKNLLVVGEVKECIAHPDSDHLKVCNVDVGNTLLQIVCGAPNVAQNQKVIVALIGCELPGLKIVKSKVRGVESSGMLCSLLELGVSEELLSEQQKNGIEILVNEAIVGESVLSYVGLDDVIFELGITPNRSDVIALNNLLKEISAILNQPIQIEIPTNHLPNGTLTYNASNESVNVTYISAQAVSNVKIKQSSEKIQSILKLNNIKVINNLVDISNYVSLLTGQPNHIYDARQVKGSLRIVDNYEGEFVALDGNTYMIEKGDLMIFDDEKPLGIAGIMGGEHSKVLDDTSDVVIEIANFNRMSIRNTARRLNITSDASIKYQKNIDPKASEFASRYLIQLLIDEAEATIIHPKTESKPKEIVPVKLQVNVEQLNKHLGTTFPIEDVQSVFKRLDFKVDNQFVVEIPSYRSDITVVEDLYEEVIRLLGYEHLPVTLPNVNPNNKSISKIQKMQRQIEDLLTHLGLYNALTYTLVSDELNQLAINPTGEALTLQSPLSSDRKWIRRSIVPSLLETLAYNEKRNTIHNAFFEISDVTSKNSSENRLAIALSGSLQQTHWSNYMIEADFYLIKNIVKTIVTHFGFDEKRIFIKAIENNSLFHPYQSAQLLIGKEVIATFGVVHPTIQKQFSLKKTVVAEMNITKLVELKTGKIQYKLLSKYQSITRDISILLDKTITFEQLKQVIQKEGKQMVRFIEVYDIYEGENIDSDKKSITIRIGLQSDVETLSSQQSQEIIDKITTVLQTQYNVQIR